MVYAPYFFVYKEISFAICDLAAFPVNTSERVSSLVVLATIAYKSRVSKIIYKFNDGKQPK